MLVFVFNVFGDRFTGWSQAGVALLSAGIILRLAAGINLLRRRRALQLPDDVGPVELAVFTVVPAVPSFVFGDRPVMTALGIIAGNLVILSLVYVVVGFGLVPTTSGPAVRPTAISARSSP